MPGVPSSRGKTEPKEPGLAAGDDPRPPVRPGPSGPVPAGVRRPELPTMLSEVSSEDWDVCVFQLVRLWTETWRFVRPEANVPAIIGERHNFTGRYQTNNYGLTGKSSNYSTMLATKGHLLASEAGFRIELRDIHQDRIAGVTAKTPCCAGMLPIAFADPQHSKELVREYIESLASSTIPAGFDWIGAGV